MSGRNDMLAATTGVTNADDPPDPQIVRAVAGLSVRQRSVVYLACWEDMTEAEIARVLDAHLGTVRRHLHRAQTHLRKALR